MPRRMAFAVLMLVMAAGCRAAARRTEMPRVDLELGADGNRGYLLGAAPAAGDQKTTRQMIQADIEIPTMYKAKVGGTPVDLGEPLSAEPMAGDDERRAGEITMMPDAPVDLPEAAPGAYDTYVVRSGDSLWIIAAKPEIYGHATHWRRIFDANRDLLNSPDRLKAGMTIKIPRGEDGTTTFGEDGGDQKK